MNYAFCKSFKCFGFSTISDCINTGPTHIQLKYVQDQNQMRVNYIIFRQFYLEFGLTNSQTIYDKFL